MALALSGFFSQALEKIAVSRCLSDFDAAAELWTNFLQRISRGNLDSHYRGKRTGADSSDLTGGFHRISKYSSSSPAFANPSRA